MELILCLKKMPVYSNDNTSTASFLPIFAFQNFIKAIMKNQKAATIAFGMLVLIIFLATANTNAQARMPRFTPEERDWSEYDLTGWRFGINMGLYFSNNYSAQYFSGERFNDNNIEYVLNNKYWYEEIYQELNSNNIYKINDGNIPDAWASSLEEWKRQYGITDGEKAWWIYYPLDMKYNATIMPGFYVKYNFNNTTGIFVQSNYVKLVTSGVFQMVIDSVTYSSEPALRTGYIRGKQEQVTIDVGISKFYRVGGYTSIFIETGLQMNSLRVLESRIQIGKQQYTLVNRYGSGGYIPNNNSYEYDIYQGGIGFGIFLNGGVKFILNESVSIDPGVQVAWKNVNLEGYRDFAPDAYVYLRLIFDLF